MSILLQSVRIPVPKMSNKAVKWTQKMAFVTLTKDDQKNVFPRSRVAGDYIGDLIYWLDVIVYKPRLM